MSDGVGRTSWFSMDAAWDDRDYQLDMGERFGAAGIAAMYVFWSISQQQTGAAVARANRAGLPADFPIQVNYRQLRRRAHLQDDDQAREIVAYATEIGALRSFESHENGRRFSCIVSGFAADQKRGDAALRQRDYRHSKDPNPENTRDFGSLSHEIETCHPDAGPVAQESDLVGHVARPGDVSPLPDQTRPEKNNLLLVDDSATGAAGSEPDGSDATDSASKDGLSDRDVERGKASDEDRRLCRLLAEHMRRRNPKAKIGSETSWLRSMRLLRERDGNTPGEIEQLITWLFTDPGDDADFWAGTIQSPKGLREHFGTVWGKMHPRAAGRRPAATGQHAGGRETAPPCPVPADSTDAAALIWAQVAEKTRQVAPEFFTNWCGSVHPHSIEPDGTLVLGAERVAANWITNRLLKVMATAADRPVVMKACAGPAGQVAA